MSDERGLVLSTGGFSYGYVEVEAGLFPESGVTIAFQADPGTFGGGRVKFSGDLDERAYANGVTPLALTRDPEHAERSLPFAVLADGEPGYCWAKAEYAAESEENSKKIFVTTEYKTLAPAAVVVAGGETELTLTVHGEAVLPGGSSSASASARSRSCSASWLACPAPLWPPREIMWGCFSPLPS